MLEDLQAAAPLPAVRRLRFAHEIVDHRRVAQVGTAVGGEGERRAVAAFFKVVEIQPRARELRPLVTLDEGDERLLGSAAFAQMQQGVC